jgi:hypothetical protein
MSREVGALRSDRYGTSLPRRLLVSLDASAAGRATLDYAQTISQANHGCIVMMLVFSERWCMGPWPAPAIPPPIAQVEGAEVDWLMSAVDSVPHDVGVTHLMSRGPAGPALASAAVRHSCDAVVIGRRSWRPWAGAVERYVRAHLPMPVIVVPT